MKYHLPCDGKIILELSFYELSDLADATKEGSLVNDIWIDLDQICDEVFDRKERRT
jgi:hypothetical protein